MFPPSTEGVTLSGLRHGARLKADSILEKSVHDTDAEGAKGIRPNLSGKRTEFTTEKEAFPYPGSLSVSILCGGLWPPPFLFSPDYFSFL